MTCHVMEYFLLVSVDVLIEEFSYGLFAAVTTYNPVPVRAMKTWLEKARLTQVDGKTNEILIAKCGEKTHFQGGSWWVYHCLSGLR